MMDGFDSNDGRTHFVGCWQDHFDCARFRIKELEAQDTENMKRISRLENYILKLEKERKGNE